MSLPPLVWRNALLTFLLSIMLGAVLGFITFIPLWLSILIMFSIVAAGILFDMIGVAVAAATEQPLHAMGADRVAGAKQAIWLVRNADLVANICNDVVGDVCNTISGAITAGFTVAIAARYSLDQSLISILAIAAIAALNVGGKAAGKIFALKRPQEVIVIVGRILLWFGITPVDKRRRRRQTAGANQGRR